PKPRAHERRARGAADYERTVAAEQERVIVEALSDLRDMDVREVMTPRTDVVALTTPVSAEDVAGAVRASGHSAYPVVNEGLDDVVGVLYVNDLFRSRRWRDEPLSPEVVRAQETLPSGPGVASGTPRLSIAKTAEGREPTGLSPIEISRRIRQAYVVPESRPILAALVEMRAHRRGFAVVVDEYGGVSGVLTVKDLLEPIVGELHDELDVDEPPSIVRIDGTRWLVDGQTNVDDVRERLEIDVPEGEYVTLGGFILDELGHIPLEGEIVRVGHWELAVREMDKRRIALVLVRRQEQALDSTAGSEDAGAAATMPGRAGAAPSTGTGTPAREAAQNLPREPRPPGEGPGALR
ncbi:MAG: hemolysin family protein, partial [Acidimicrobiales bacterium]